MIPKWEFENLDSCYPKTLDARIFPKSSLFLKIQGKYLIVLKKISPTVYNMP
jgi:hypothetical protein